MIQLGGVVPLSVQLSDGNERARVHVRVLNPAEEVIFEADLESFPGGLYSNRQFLMPELPFVTATYQIFGVTNEGGEYERGAEIFYRDVSFEQTRALFEEFTPQYQDFYTGQVVSESFDDFIEGTMSVQS